jgi:cysteine synthase
MRTTQCVVRSIQRAKLDRILQNWQSYIRWTRPQIHEQLPGISVICAGMGTSGTMTGLGQYFKGVKPSVTRLGCVDPSPLPVTQGLTHLLSNCTATGDRVPGPRSPALVSPLTFPWRDSVDAVEEAGSEDAFRLPLQLCREGLICGPSSGFNLQGTLTRPFV